MKSSRSSSLFIFKILLLVVILLNLTMAHTDDTNCTIVSYSNSDLSFGLINGGSAFFEPIRDGWETECKRFNVNCYYCVADGNCTYPRVEQFNNLLYNIGVNGIAFKPCREEIEMSPMIYDATDNFNIPVLTFDSDVPNTTRTAYLGTDNYFMGRTMARLLRQLRPEGGTYVIIGKKREREAGFRAEISRYNNRDDRSHWYEINKYDVFTKEEIDTIYDGQWLEEMERFIKYNPTAYVTVVQSPMKEENWTYFIDKYRYKNITYIGADADEIQLKYLNSRYVDGLVGQLPYEFGRVAAQTLYDVVVNNKKLEKNKTIDINIVAYNLIPLDLPKVNLDENLIGNLKYVGYMYYIITIVLSIACIGWTLYHKKCVVVRATQPFFLVMVATGVIILSSTLIPLSFEDGGEDQPIQDGSTKEIAVCMSIPWLAFTGFTVIFSALFSKTWRINRMVHTTKTKANRIHHYHGRIHVSEMDVLAPFAILLICNIVVLTCWTVLDPLIYIRQENDGTDYWNRPISTYGSCRSEKNSITTYLVPLAVINFLVIVIASIQALQARNIQSEFAESKYIGLAIASFFQSFLTGIPVVVVVRDMPQAYYLLLSSIIFLLCMAVLLLIFLPKIFIQRKYAGMTEAEQKEMFLETIKRRRSSNANNKGGGGVIDNNNRIESLDIGKSGVAFRDSSYIRSNEISSTTGIELPVNNDNNDSNNNGIPEFIEPPVIHEEDNDQEEDSNNKVVNNVKEVSDLGSTPLSESVKNPHSTDVQN